MAFAQELEQPQRGNGDEQLLVKFFIHPKLDQTATAEQGRPIYRETEFIDIRVPGSPDNVVRPATQIDIQRFPRHYAAFKNRVTEDYIEGTLLSEWPLVNRSQVEELAFFGIKTVEQLSQVSDANGQGLMGFQSLKRKAREWLDNAAQGVTLAEMKEQLARRDEELEALRLKVEELSNPKPKTPRKKAQTKKE